MTKTPYRTDTQLTHLARDAETTHGAVNLPVFRASTLLCDRIETFEKPERRYQKDALVYGRLGTPSSYALEAMIAELEGGAGCVLVSSGLAAISCALLALVESGDHILVTDSAYKPTRTLCDTVLKRLGVETSYYDPLIGSGIAALFRDNTRLVFTESPGSLTFEMQDLPAIAAAAKSAEIAVITDNSWATPLNAKPLTQGVDVSIQAGTKYLVGHADAMLGAITANAKYEDRIRRVVRDLGISPGADEIFLTLRGLRTLAIRLARHQETGLHLARWLRERPEVARVLHPGLPDDPGHAIWRRDMTGASGLFGLVLAKPYPKKAVVAMIDGLALFGIGPSWGGYESLLITGYPEKIRTATRWQAPGPLLRIHAGLEDPEDLIADLEAGFARLNAA